MSRLSTQVSGHISELQLDRYFGRELSDEERATLEQHLQCCAGCSELHAVLHTQRAEFLARVPSWEALHRSRAPRARWQWLGGATLVVAAAVALMLAPRAGQLDSGVRLKGAPSISLFVKRGERVMRASSGDAFLPGDLLRVTYSAEYPVYFALFHRDAERVVTHFPAGPANTPALVQAGRNVALDFSIQLDGRPGTEQLLALFCDRPIELETARRSLARTKRLPTIMHCQLDALMLNKTP